MGGVDGLVREGVLCGCEAPLTPTHPQDKLGNQ